MTLIYAVAVSRHSVAFQYRGDKHVALLDGTVCALTSPSVELSTPRTEIRHEDIFLRSWLPRPKATSIQGAIDWVISGLAGLWANDVLRSPPGQV
jgi:hypothetical protein